MMAGIQDFLRNNSSALLQGGVGLLSGKNAQEQAAMGFQGFGNALQANKTIKFLEATNPELAQAVKSGALTGGDAYKMYYQQKLEAQKPKNNLMAVGKNLYDAETRSWIAPPTGMASADDEEWGLNPVWGKNADGKTVLGQLSKSGKFKPLDTGEFQPTPVLQSIDTGTSVLGRNSRTGEVVVETPKDLIGAASDTKLGASQGEARASYNSMNSKMPGLEQVVKKLDDLSTKATYTTAGQMLDLGRKQIGMEPREAAVARAEYIATVDNQVLPLLRDTFGAAFTQKEGETLRATLGDPDKSPQEKQVVLKSFIEQKRRDLSALGAESGRPAAPAAPAGGVVDYRDYFKK